MTGKWQYNQYRHDPRVCLNEVLNGSALSPSASNILVNFLLLPGIGKILIYAVIIWKNNVFSCFVLLIILAINNCVVIQLHMWVTCSTLSHCILVNNLWKSRGNGMKRNSPKRETKNQFFWNGKSLALLPAASSVSFLARKAWQISPANERVVSYLAAVCWQNNISTWRFQVAVSYHCISHVSQRCSTTNHAPPLAPKFSSTDLHDSQIWLFSQYKTGIPGKKTEQSHPW